MKRTLTAIGFSLLAVASQAMNSSSLINLSNRGLAGTGHNANITGFVVDANPGELRWVLIRGIGPSLSQFNVANPLADPTFIVRDHKGTAISANDNWADAPNLSVIESVLPVSGAFPVTNANEAVALVGVPSGNYTIVTTGKSETPGAVLSEVYELGAVDADLSSQTLSGLAASNPNLTTLATALRLTGLDVVLTGKGSFTVFAPTDAAFAALPAGTLETLVANPTQLADILKYHVLSTQVLSTNLTEGAVVPTLLSGKSVTVSLAGGPKINTSNVVAADVMAVNGVVHVIDRVLLP